MFCPPTESDYQDACGERTERAWAREMKPEATEKWDSHHPKINYELINNPELRWVLNILEWLSINMPTLKD